MKLDKICEALNGTDELGSSLNEGCAVAQLFYVAGKTNEEFSTQGLKHCNYDKFFDDLLAKKYGMDCDEINDMVNLNDRFHSDETDHDRHKRVLAHYENELIECLISQSSSPVEADSKVCVGV